MKERCIHSDRPGLFRLHPIYRDTMLRVAGILLFLALIQLLSWLIPDSPGARSIEGYLPLHTLLETVSIVISMLIFAVGWNSHSGKLPGNIVLLACVFFSVGWFDLAHTLSYVGMPTFISPNDSEKHLSFWLSARFLASASLLFVAVRAWHPHRYAATRYLVLSAMILTMLLITMMVIYHQDWLPSFFIPGIGLTPLKKNIEYLIIAIDITTALMLWHKMQRPQPFNVALLFGAACAMAMSEFFFTLYTTMTGSYNVLGHLYKVIAYLLIYRAIVVETIVLPYNQLRESQEQLRATLDALPEMLLEVDTAGHIFYYHASHAGNLIEANGELAGKSIGDIMPAQATTRFLNVVHEADQAGYSHEIQLELLTPDGHRWFELSAARKMTQPYDERHCIVLMYDITKQKQHEQELRLTQTAIDNSSSAFFRLNPNGAVLYANRHACQMLGYDADELFGMHVWDFDPDLSEAAWITMWPELKKTGTFNTQMRHRRKDGQILSVEVTGNYIVSDGEEFSFTFVQDITQHKLAEQNQKRLNRALALLSKCNTLLIHAENEQEILSDICKLTVEAGGHLMAWVGFAEHGADRAVRPVAQFGCLDGYLDDADITWADTQKGQGPTGTAIRMRQTVINQNILTNPAMQPWRKAATIQGFESSIALPLISNKKVLGALNIYAFEPNAFFSEEVTLLEELANDLAFGIQTLRTRNEHHAAEKKLHFLAHHDPLTGLPNRLLLLDRFNQAAALANREQSGVSVLFLDIDNFKHVNDSLGHTVGDQLLISVTERIQTCIRDTDTISRQGGDEFIILLPHMHDLPATHSIAQKIIDAFVEPFNIENQLLNISFSIGISLFPDDGRDFDTLLRQADTALYQAKDAGKNTYRFFSKKMNAAALENMQMQSNLHNALKNNELILNYQPQIDILSGNIIGAEALVRWQHPELGVISPARFIPLAEQSGLIIQIGEWVLNEACRQAQEWHQTTGGAAMVIAVNLSSLQFKRGNIVETVARALEKSGLPASLLELELTESIMLQDLDVVLKTLNTLKKIGVKLSIDDFGTGYSSLSYLKRLHVDKLKIDQSFVHDMVDSAEDAAIVQAIIQLGQTLQLTVIAEGVENNDQLAMLKDFGCNEIQGYLFSRPLPAQDFLEFCKR